MAVAAERLTLVAGEDLGLGLRGDVVNGHRDKNSGQYIPDDQSAEGGDVQLDTVLTCCPGNRTEKIIRIKSTR